MNKALNYVDDRWIEGGGEVGVCHNPADWSVAAEFVAATPQECQTGIAAARHTFDSSSWAKTPRLRAEVLLEFAANLKSRAAEVEAWLVTLSGKLAGESKGEVAAAISELYFYAGLARNLWGRTAEIDAGCYSQLMREPAGVVAIIVPWNAPVTLLIRSLAPALAAGCTVVVKAAHQTALVHQLVMECLTDISFLPKGVVTSLVESGNINGQALCESREVDVISFTGSSATGKRIAAASAGTLKRLSLELGGKAPALILADANIDSTVAGVAAGSLRASGQQCTAIARVLVQEGIYNEFAEKLTNRLSGIVLGPGNEPASQLGPVIDLINRDRIAGLAAEAKQHGRVLLQGGIPQGRLSKGAFVSPTLVEIDDLASSYIQDELFGPLLVLERFATNLEALRRSNATRYGLAASVWTRDYRTGLALARELKSGTVWLNDHNRLFAEAETGGYRESGLGRLHGVDGLNDFLSTKHVYWESRLLPQG